MKVSMFKILLSVVLFGNILSCSSVQQRAPASPRNGGGSELGNGGGACVCRDPNSSIIEARQLDSLDADDSNIALSSSLPIESIIKKAPKLAATLIESYKDIENKMIFLPEGKSLTKISDFTVYSCENSQNMYCGVNQRKSLEQLANFTNKDELLVAKDIYDNLSNKDKEMFKYHEAIYYWDRKINNATTSDFTREVVIALFSSNFSKIGEYEKALFNENLVSQKVKFLAAYFSKNYSEIESIIKSGFDISSLNYDVTYDAIKNRDLVLLKILLSNDTSFKILKANRQNIGKYIFSDFKHSLELYNLFAKYNLEVEIKESIKLVIDAKVNSYYSEISSRNFYNVDLGFDSLKTFLSAFGKVDNAILNKYLPFNVALAYLNFYKQDSDVIAYVIDYSKANDISFLQNTGSLLYDKLVNISCNNYELFNKLNRPSNCFEADSSENVIGAYSDQELRSFIFSKSCDEIIEKVLTNDRLWKIFKKEYGNYLYRFDRNFYNRNYCSLSSSNLEKVIDKAEAENFVGFTSAVFLMDEVHLMNFIKNNNEFCMEFDERCDAILDVFFDKVKNKKQLFELLLEKLSTKSKVVDNLVTLIIAYSDNVHDYFSQLKKYNIKNIKFNFNIWVYNKTYNRKFLTSDSLANEFDDDNPINPCDFISFFKEGTFDNISSELSLYKYLGQCKNPKKFQSVNLNEANKK